jgi:endo-1,4-beta-D-glucanase Y/predicted membrane-bound dolichyl-phosphate-mannose-protein mannosyltransferase
MKKILTSIVTGFKSIPSETWLILGLMIIAGTAHAWNMFHFPYFEDDEATYVSQAWAFIHTGKLSPYTYYYDHAPLGWMFLGLWFLVTGGLTTFGQNPLISGRIFIFILHMFSVLFLYIITKRVTRQKLAATLAVIVFSLSPLELYFGRRVLLDNIMVFWVLLSLVFATRTPQRLREVFLSAFTFAIATLTKENALFLGPVILYIIWLYSQKRIRSWALGLWFIVASLLLSLYPLYALLKGELFPAGSLLGGAKNHVSLIQTATEQSSRGTFAFPWEHGSDFYVNLQEWLSRDPWIITVGGICLLASMILNERYREIKAIALTAIVEILFLARGKLVIDFYILSVIPLLAMIIGIMVSRPLIWAKNHISPQGYSITICLLIAFIFITSGTPAFTKDETTNQQDAINWIEKNVPKNAYLAIDNYAYPQLHDVDGYINADYVFNIQFTPEIQSGKYHYNPYNINYLLITHEEIIQMNGKQLPFVQDAFENSELVMNATNNTTSYLNISKLISTNGDWAQVYKVDKKNAGLLTDTWRNYKRNFIRDSGQVIDTSSWVTTSEGESYAMLRSVTMNDRVEFDRVWQWTQKNMQVRNGDHLFAWEINLDSQGYNHISDTNAASDADEDIALSLYQAYQKWGDTKYLDASKEIVNDIWNKEVIKRNNMLYLLSGPDNSTGNRLLINPSYLAPGNYKTFAKIDKKHNWMQLASDSYTLLDKIQSNSKVGLISNWVTIEPNGDITSASDIITENADTYGYDAFRVNWRMAEDISDPRAQAVLKKLTDFYQSEWEKNHLIFSEYDMTGKPLSISSDIPTSAGAIIGLHAMNQSLALTIYQNELTTQFHTNGMYWGQSTNYYSQNWGAFAVQYLGVGGINTVGNVLQKNTNTKLSMKKTNGNADKASGLVFSPLLPGLSNVNP